jgi:hypothetical protein
MIACSVGWGQVYPVPFPLLEQTESDQKLIVAAYLERDSVKQTFRWNGVAITLGEGIEILSRSKPWAFDMILERIPQSQGAVDSAEFERGLVWMLQDSGNPKNVGGNMGSVQG